jgi:DNA-binding protein H-NS
MRDSAEARRLEKLEDAKNAVIAEMKEKFEQMGVSSEDIEVSFGGTRRGRRASGSTLPPKYRGPNNEAWSGRGHVPKWIADLELAGHKREEYLVKSE